METFIKIIKITIISILLSVGLLSILGELIDKDTTLGWILSFIIIKLLGLFMIGLAGYLILHWKQFNPIQYEEDDEDMSAEVKEWNDEEME